MMQMMDPKVLVPDKAVVVILVLLAIMIAVKLYAGWLEKRRSRCGSRMVCDPKCGCYLGGFDYGVLYARQGDASGTAPKD
jgi:hypothetical protein